MNTASICDDWVGRVIDGRFTLLQWLGGSEWGGVFLTELPGHPAQKAAIKLIPAVARDAKAQIDCWAATAKLSHPHLARLFATGRFQAGDAPLLYAVTEYAEEILSEVLPERPLTPVEAREMLGPVLDALTYLHGKGFAHGHLKPSNILVVNNQLKLSTDSLHAAGEPRRHFPAPDVYDAPESTTGAISPASDVWSLGITLVEALTQHPPLWDRSTRMDPVVPESIPQPFADIAQRCLRRDPACRCTLNDVRARLAHARPVPGPASETVRREPEKLRRRVIVAAGLLIIVAVAALVVRSHHSRPPQPAETQQPVAAMAAPSPESPVPAAQASQSASEKGAVAERVLPDVPPKASETIQGQVNVKIRVTVDASGRVSDATLDAPGGSRYFANLALQAAHSWRFKPAQVDGRAVSSVWILQFQFRQDATDVTPVEATP